MPPRATWGKTPWGGAFLSALGQLDSNGRLARGKTIANTGKVLAFTLEGRKVVARVQGSFAPFYAVELTFPAMSDAERAVVLGTVSEQPLLLGAVLSGQLPPELLAALTQRGVHLLPRHWGDIVGGCNCPDNAGGGGGFYGSKPAGQPCKHQAAVYYLLTAEIDKDPFALFTMRGVDLKTAFAGAGGAGAASAALPWPLELALADPAVPMAADEDEQKRCSAFPPCVSFILSILTPNPPFSRTVDYKAALSEFYAHLAKRHAAALVPLAELPAGRAGARLLAALTQGELSLELGPDLRGRVRVMSALVRSDGDEDATTAPAAEVFAGVPHTFLPGGGGVALDLFTALRLLLQLPQPAACSRSFGFLHAAARTARSLIRAGALLPDVLSLAADDARWRIVWKPLATSAPVAAALDALASCYDGCVLLRDRADGSLLQQGGLVALAASSAAQHAVTALLTAFVPKLAFMHKASKASPPKESLAFFQGDVFNVMAASERSVAPAICRYFGAFELTKLDLALRLEVRRDTAGANYELSLSARRRSEPEAATVPLRAFVSSNPERRADALKLLSVLSPHLPAAPTLLTADTAPLVGAAFATLVCHAGSSLRALGVRTSLPSELAKLLKPRLVLVAKDELDDASLRSRSFATYLQQASMQAFDWRIAVGDDMLSVHEFQELMSNGAGLVAYKNRFIELDADQMTAMLDAASKAPKAPSAHALLQAALEEDEDGGSDDDVPIAAPRNGATWMRKASRAAVRDALRPRELPPPAGLRAELRPYQARGFAWLASLSSAGFGCVLADDMGLGKTIQTLALLLHLHDSAHFEAHGPALVIAPATLLANWAREAARFAPALRVHMHHGADRGALAAALGPGAVKGKGKAKRARTDEDGAPHIVLTSYGTVRAEAEAFKKLRFGAVVIDEAQVIKTAASAISKIVKSIAAPFRVALSGTPVENKLAELWSIFDFACPGFLGTLKDFNSTFAAPIERDRDAGVLASLRKITAPFLLRRLKSDPAIAADLPAKVTRDVPASLTAAQATLYQSVLNAHAADLEKSRGAVLGLITALKQVCNHPHVYDSAAHAPTLELSGKARLLVDLVAPILAAGEKVLVFSQYVSTVKLLASLLKQHLFVTPDVLTGELSVSEKDAVVTRFQSDPASSILILSLKAGGVGLNLTAASHVIHFDLWWNPQVENQATDRAYRIGQTSRVMVYRLLCHGTFEERINEMMARKRELSDMSVNAGESWLADMDAAELRELFALRPTADDAPAADEEGFDS